MDYLILADGRWSHAAEFILPGFGLYILLADWLVESIFVL
jgi:hypothetical protein